MRTAELPNYVNIVFDQYYFKYNPHIPVHYVMLYVCYTFSVITREGYCPPLVTNRIVCISNMLLMWGTGQGEAPEIVPTGRSYPGYTYKQPPLVVRVVVNQSQ